jgi:hypothetical protein
MIGCPLLTLSAAGYPAGRPALAAVVKPAFDDKVVIMVVEPAEGEA